MLPLRFNSCSSLQGDRLRACFLHGETEAGEAQRQAEGHPAQGRPGTCMGPCVSPGKRRRKRVHRFGASWEKTTCPSCSSFPRDTEGRPRPPPLSSRGHTGSQGEEGRGASGPHSCGSTAPRTDAVTARGAPSPPGSLFGVPAVRRQQKRNHQETQLRIESETCKVLSSLPMKCALLFRWPHGWVLLEQNEQQTGSDVHRTGLRRKNADPTAASLASLRHLSAVGPGAGHPAFPSVHLRSLVRAC